MAIVKTILLTSLAFLSQFAIAQSFNGQIGDNLTYKPLTEACITVKDKPISCHVDKNGIFQIDLSAAIVTDLIIISCPGYKPKLLLRQEIIDAWYDIKLSPINNQKVIGVNADIPGCLPEKAAIAKSASAASITSQIVSRETLVSFPFINGTKMAVIPFSLSTMLPSRFVSLPRQ